jgi:ankyrin repeat protein
MTRLIATLAVLALGCLDAAATSVELDRSLVEAARRADLGAASRLLQQGASPNAMIPVLKLQAAPQRTALAEDGPADAAARYGETALAAAARSGSLEIARLLLTAGARSDRAGALGTPLAIAALRDDLAMAELLLAAGADPNLRDGGGATPLYRAVLAGDADLARRLVAAGATPRLRSPGSAGRGPQGTETSGVPLIEAARRGRSDLVALLLDAGASANAPDGEHKPAVFWALLEGGDEVALLLLERGADPDRFVDGYHLLHFARVMGREGAAQRIEAAQR